MTDSNKKQSSGILSNTFGLAKKLGTTGLSMLNHAAPNSVNKLDQTPQKSTVIEGKAHSKNMFEKKQYDNPQQMIREHLPQVSSQLLGRHYKKINNVASFISPQFNDKMSDYFFDKLNDFVSETSSVERLLKEVGVKNLNELSQDSARSQRISGALANQNKILAAIQGALTGATGVIGSAIDVPTSIALALRSIYQTGRAHGFELKPEDHEIVEFIFKKIDLGTVAEKQALLITLRAVSTALQNHDISQFQQVLGSNYSTDVLKNWLTNSDGTFKWAWLDYIPQLNLISKITPFISIGVSASYSWKLVEDATDKAQLVFKGAQQYLLQHPNENISALAAFEKSEILLSQASPLLQPPKEENAQQQEAVLEAKANQAQSTENDTIQEVQVLKKDEAETLLAQEENSIADLAKAHVSTVNETETPVEVEQPVTEPVKKTRAKKRTSDSASEKLTEKSQQNEKSATKKVEDKPVQTEVENSSDDKQDSHAIAQNIEATTETEKEEPKD